MLFKTEQVQDRRYGICFITLPKNESIVSFNIWDTDSDLPCIGMAGQLVTDQHTYDLTGYRDVGTHTGHPPKLSVVKSRVGDLEYFNLLTQQWQDALPDPLPPLETVIGFQDGLLKPGVTWSHFAPFDGEYVVRDEPDNGETFWYWDCPSRHGESRPKEVIAVPKIVAAPAASP